MSENGTIVSAAFTTTALQTQAEFQERMQARMRAAMGELMPDAVLADICKRGIEEAFFKPRKERESVYSSYEREKPPWVVEFIEKELKARVRDAVEAWVRDNPEQVQQAVGKALAGGLASAMVRSLDDLLAPAFHDLHERFAKALQSVR